MMDPDKHPLEAKKSWEGHLNRLNVRIQQLNEDDIRETTEDSSEDSIWYVGRFLRHRENDKKQNKKIQNSRNKAENAEDEKKKSIEENERKKVERHKELEDFLLNSGIDIDTTHGMMIDAGSSGSRIHVYEFENRIIRGEKDAQMALKGKKLSYPGTETRWTDRLRPGIADFALFKDEELVPALSAYLRPLLDFAETVLRTKAKRWDEFPIYLKATAGMRILDKNNRLRVINACREILHNVTFNPFKFETEQARVISGEEEAIYGWAAANFVLGSLLQASEGSGTVMNPTLTHGSIEMGGASAQIAFYQNDEDIMANLFKLQIGQGKHWNVYAHSYLYFGIDQAFNRMGALLATGQTTSSAIPSSVYNPCLPGGSQITFTSDIYFFEGHETRLSIDGTDKSYSTTLKNDGNTGDYDKCSAIANSLVNKRYNTWCEFAHHGSCALNGVYQPPIPQQQAGSFGEFLAFANYFDVLNFMHIAENKTNIGLIQNSTKKLCSMSHKDLMLFNNGRVEETDALKMCFRAAFILELLVEGYGFELEQNITATDVVAGQKVGWALGSMLYEINTLPWIYLPKHETEYIGIMLGNHRSLLAFLFISLGCILTASLVVVCKWKRIHRARHGYTNLSTTK